jgi:hypothetical protein
MSRIAVIADIHGNSLALDAVLADLDTQGGADLILNLGDLAVFGPDPVGVLELLDQRRPMRYVRGNTDRYLAEGTNPRGQSSDSWEEQVLASFPWTAEQLGAAGLKFLADLPTCQYLPKQLIMAVHGTIYSDEGNIRPDTPISELEPLVPITPFFRGAIWRACFAEQLPGFHERLADRLGGASSGGRGLQGHLQRSDQRRRHVPLPGAWMFLGDVSGETIHRDVAAAEPAERLAWRDVNPLHDYQHGGRPPARQAPIASLAA